LRVAITTVGNGGSPVGLNVALLKNVLLPGNQVPIPAGGREVTRVTVAVF
jgi:hypothetical protein